ncbi:MAG: TrkH family potassium uptake protein [Oscillospiraceae bacterium]|nr:TrkH family potassium uptake protein [Oscillospiraceae bacterium]
MNGSVIRYFLGWVTCFSGLFLLPSCVVAVIYQETEGVAYLACALVYLALGWLITRRKPVSSQFYAKEGFVTVALTWVLISLLGAVPFTLSGDIPFYVDAVFETASGFTTTGATILSDIESLSYASHFWRCLTHWLGGMGVLVFVLVFLPMGGGNAIHLMRAESTGPSVEKLVPKMRETAATLYGIYVAMTLVQLVLLLLGGMSFFEAITTCFSTAGTGGFCVKNSSMAGYSPYIQYVVTIFMFLFGVSFNVYFLVLLRKFKAALLYEELRWYFIVVAVATAAVVMDIRHLFPTLEEAFRQGLFQVVSVITTTGYVSYDWQQWPVMAQSVLIFIMFVGACAGSTGGGMKVSRFLVMGKFMKSELRRFRHPRLVEQIRLNGAVVNNDMLRSVLVYLVSYLLIFVVSLFLITLEGYDLVTNFTAVATTFNNVGPGLNLVGPVQNFGFLNPFSKLVLSFDMLAGRLEVLPFMVMLSAIGSNVERWWKSVQAK